MGIACLFYVDVSFKLCCQSLMPRTWIPLDKCINDSIWEKKCWDDSNKWWIMDDANMLVYLMARSVFDKCGFRIGYKTEIVKRLVLIDHDEVQNKLRSVFFAFTPKLTALVKAHQFERVIDSLKCYFSCLKVLSFVQGHKMKIQENREN